jgi:signal transduction histidine kinase
MSKENSQNRLISSGVFLIGIFLSITCYSSPVIDSLLRLGNFHLEKIHYDWAGRVAEELDKQIDLSEENEQLFNYYAFKANYYSRLEKYDEQFSCLKKTEELSNKLNDRSKKASVLIGFSAYYEQFNNLKKALPYILKAIDEYTFLKEEHNLAYQYNKLGLIYYADGDYKKAKKYFEVAYTLYFKHRNESVENAYWVQNSLSNIGLCYQQSGEEIKALAIMKMALRYCQTAPFEKGRPIAVIKTNIGAIYGDLHQIELAKYYLNQGIKECFLPENNELSHGIESLIYLATIYSAFKNFKSADSCFQLANTLIISNENWFIQDYYFQQIAVHMANKGDYKSAFFAHKKYLEITDSIDKAMEKSSFGKQILLYSLEKKEMENELLSKEYKYKSLEVKVVIAFVIFFLIGIGVVYNNLRKIKTKNLALLTLNEQVTKQKSDLEELNLTLYKINQNKNYLIQSIAHDLRTPIGNVMSLNGLLEDHIKQEGEGLEYQNLIESSCQMALNIIEDILDQSMIERGKLNLKKTETVLPKIVEETVAMLQFRWQPKEILVQTKFATFTPIFIDEDRIKRVILNILINAIKFSPRASSIYIEQTQNETTCLLKISDQGIGMSEEILAQIFEKNTKVGREGLENEKTIGIGLSIAKSIVEEHHGKIYVESEPNYGSTFYIELPLGKFES